MSLSQRLDRLEQRAGACPDCGEGGDAPVKFRPIVFDVDGAQVLEPDARPNPCPRCGRRPMKFNAVTFDGAREVQ